MPYHLTVEPDIRYRWERFDCFSNRKDAASLGMSIACRVVRSDDRVPNTDLMNADQLTEVFNFYRALWDAQSAIIRGHQFIIEEVPHAD